MNKRAVNVELRADEVVLLMGGGDTDIIVTGPYPPYYWTNDDENSDPGGSGGGGGSEPPADPSDSQPRGAQMVHPYSKTCSSASGTAVDLSKVLRGATGSPPNPPIKTPQGSDWTQVEFGAGVLRDSAGRYTATGQGIYSMNQQRYNSIALEPGTVGVWHNHPDAAGAGSYSDAEGRYPSDRTNEGSNDWSTLQIIKDRYGAGDPSFNPSLWITDFAGVTREFLFSERSYYEGLSSTDRVNGVGLAGKERNQACN